MAHHEPANAEGSGQDEPKSPPQPEAGAGAGAGRETRATGNVPADRTASTANPINMALLELQEEVDQPGNPTQPSEPVPVAGPTPAHAEPAAPETGGSPEARGGATSPVETPAAPEQEGTAAAASPRTEEQSSVPPTAAMSSTPPITGQLPRPGNRPPTPGPVASPQATESGPPLTAILVGGAVVWFLFGILGAWAYEQFGRKGRESAESTAASANSPTDEAGPAAPSAAELDPLKTQVATLGDQVDAFEEQLAEIPEPTEPPDLAPIRQRIDDVAKSVDAIKPLSEQLQGINARMEGLETSVSGLKGELGSLQAKPSEPEDRSATPGSSAATSTPATPATAEGEPKADATAANSAFSEGIELLNNGKFEEAYKLFETMETKNPNDARVWYFAALSHGWAKNDFKLTGKTEELFKQGIEREKAGTPSAAEIDAAFRDLTSASGKEWLGFKRKESIK